MLYGVACMLFFSHYVRFHKLCICTHTQTRSGIVWISVLFLSVCSSFRWYLFAHTHAFCVPFLVLRVLCINRKIVQAYLTFLYNFVHYLFCHLSALPHLFHVQCATCMHSLVNCRYNFCLPVRLSVFGSRFVCRIFILLLHREFQRVNIMQLYSQITRNGKRKPSKQVDPPETY